jgi:hypothetical protein
MCNLTHVRQTDKILLADCVKTLDATNYSN